MINLPAIKISVPTKRLTQNPEKWGSTQGYLVAVKSEPSNPLKFTVYLESGALWSGLTIDDIYCGRYKFEVENTRYYQIDELQPYSCLSKDISLIEYEFMKNMHGKFKIGCDSVEGIYLFTLDTYGMGTLADDPEQYKTFNVVQLENNQIAALPNNYCSWHDEFMFDEEKAKDRAKYRRNANYPLAGG